jgi:DNA-binding transcriptional ArsR family regulator
MPARLDALFAALSDPTRRAVVARLAQGPCTVKALAEPFPLSLPTFSKHLKVLEQAGLVERTVDGRFHTLHLVERPLRDAMGWLEGTLGVPAELKGFLAALPLARPAPAAEALAKARRLAATLKPRMAVIARALAKDPAGPDGFSPEAHRARLLALEAHADPGLADQLAEALACFEALEAALVAGDAAALERAVLPAGQLAYAWARHPVLREVAAS